MWKRRPLAATPAEPVPGQGMRVVWTGHKVMLLAVRAAIHHYRCVPAKPPAADFCLPAAPRLAMLFSAVGSITEAHVFFRVKMNGKKKILASEIEKFKDCFER
jgi:hypothetical protein